MDFVFISKLVRFNISAVWLGPRVGGALSSQAFTEADRKGGSEMPGFFPSSVLQHKGSSSETVASTQTTLQRPEAYSQTVHPLDSKVCPLT